ncbi:HPP family-domain-containing protein [Geopyxis carbonaria]|nr:HPP family-domain-containing protein [Geopyxis carbonaria]
MPDIPPARQPAPEPPLPPTRFGDFDVDHYLNRILPAPRLHLLPPGLRHMLGHRTPAAAENPPRPPPDALLWLWSSLGVFTSLLLIAYLTERAAPVLGGDPHTVIVGSMGAAAILLYLTPASPLAQPRNAILSQVLASVVGVALAKVCEHATGFTGVRWVVGAGATALAALLMAASKTVHPPAGATALLAATDPVIIRMGWRYILVVTLGSIIMVLGACLFGNVGRRYPVYWWTPEPLKVRVEKERDEEEARGRERKRESGESSGAESERVENVGVWVDRNGVHVPEWMLADQRTMEVLQGIRERLEERADRDG